MDTGKGKYADIIANNRPDFAPDGNCDGILDRNYLDLNLSTAEYVVKKLKDLGGFTIHKDTTLFGQNYVRAIMENGIGKTVFIRGLIQSSPSNQARELGAGIREYDTAALLAAIRTLVSAKDHWCGNLVVLFRPDELDPKELRDIIDTTRAGLIETQSIIPDFIFAHHVCDMKSGLAAFREGPIITFCDEMELYINTRIDPESDLTPDGIINWITTEVPENIRTSLGLEMAPTISHVTNSNNPYQGALRFKITTQYTTTCPHQDVIKSLKDILISNPERHKGLYLFKDMESTDDHCPGLVHQAFREHFGIDFSHMATAPYPEDFLVWQCTFPAPYAYWHIGGLTPTTNTAEEVQSTLKTGADAMALAVLSVLGDSN